jgi:hypothetical protein
MSLLPLNDPDSRPLRLVIDHVFMPPRLPQEDPGEQIEQEMNVALCSSLIDAAREFLQTIPPSEHPLWMHMIKMMDVVHRAAISPFQEVDLQQELAKMDCGGTSR